MFLDVSNQLFLDDEQFIEPEAEQNNSPPFRMFKSNRGGHKLFMNGFSFERSETKKNDETSTEYWRCEMFRKRNNCCPARLNTVINVDGSRVISKDPGEHNHEGRAERAEVAAKLSLLKTVAVANTGNIISLYFPKKKKKN